MKICLFARTGYAASVVLLLLVCVFPMPACAGSTGPLRWGSVATVKAGGAGWGRMTRLGDGDWLAVYTVFPADAPTRLQVARSNDNARTWSTIATVAEPGRDLDNGNLIQLPNGDVLLALRSLVKGRSYRLVVYRSRDAGVTWNYLSTIDSNEDPGGRTDRGLWEPSFNLLADGTLSVLYANEKHAPEYSQIVSQRISVDGGATWGHEIWAVYQKGGGSARPGMPVMTSMGNGKYIVVFEVCGQVHDCDVAYQISSDGMSWPGGLGTHIDHQRCGPYVLSTTDGRLLVTSCRNEISYSDDYGSTWLKNEPAAWPIGFRYSWPALYQTGKNEIAVMNVTAGGAIQIRFGTLAPAVNAP